MASPQLQVDTTSEGSSLPIPVWTEQEQETHPTLNPSSKSTTPRPPVSQAINRKPVSDDGLHVVPRKPVYDEGLQVVERKPVADDGLQVVGHDSGSDQSPPAYETWAAGRCMALPSRAAEWRVRGADREMRLCTLAAAVLVRERVLDGANVELIRMDGEEREAADGEETSKESVAAPKISTFDMISKVQRSASKSSLRSYQRKRAAEEGRRETAGSAADDGAGRVSRASSSNGRASELSLNGVESEEGGGRVAKKPSNGAERLDRFAEGVANSGEGFARAMNTGLGAPGLYTHKLARGLSNAPRRYGDDTVRAKVEVVGFTSGLEAAGKGFGYGLYDGIAGFFVQPVKGAQKEGAKGFVKGVVKGVSGVVIKPAAGGLGLAGHTLVGIQRSIEKAVARKPSEDECIAVASVWQGEEELRSLTVQEKTSILSAWFAGSR